MKKQILSVFLLLLLSNLAHAHNGDTILQGFSAGFIHPVTGWDHLLMMVAVGLMAAQSVGRMRWLLPATFVAMMVIGGAVGVVSGSLSQLELMIAATILLMGATLLLNQSLSNLLKIGLVGLFALPHGWAHGVEIGAQGASTLIGILVATVVLHAVGYALIQSQPLLKLSINRVAACLMLVLGGLLLVS